MNENIKEIKYELREAFIKLKADADYLQMLRDKKLYAESFATFQSKIIDIFQNIKSLFKILSKSRLLSNSILNDKKTKLMAMNFNPDVKNVFESEAYLSSNKNGYNKNDILKYTKSNYNKMIEELKRDEINFNKIITNIRGYARNDKDEDIWSVAERLGVQNVIVYPKDELDTIIYIKKNIQKFVLDFMNNRFKNNKSLEGKSYKSIKPAELCFIHGDYPSLTDGLREYYRNLSTNNSSVLPAILTDALYNYINFMSTILYLLGAADKLTARELGLKDHLAKLNFSLVNKRMVGACKALDDAAIEVINKGKAKTLSETDIDQIDLYKYKVMKLAAKSLNLMCPLESTENIYGLMRFIQKAPFLYLSSNDIINFKIMEGKDASIICVGPVKELSEEESDRHMINSSSFNAYYLSFIKNAMKNKNFDIEAAEKTIDRISDDIEFSILKNPAIKPKAYNARESYENKIIEIAYELVVNAMNLLSYEYYSILAYSAIMGNIGHPVYDYIKRDIGAVSIALHKYALDMNYKE